MSDLQQCILAVGWLPLFWFIIKNVDMPPMREAVEGVILYMPFAFIAICATSVPLVVVFLLWDNLTVTGTITLTIIWFAIVAIKRCAILRFIAFLEKKL